MKDSEYVNRFYDGVVARTNKIIREMAEQLLAEFNAELRTTDYSQESINRLMWKYNNKGNRIAELMNRKYSWQNPGHHIVNVTHDWFRNIVKIEKENKPKRKKEERKCKTLREELESWE